MGDLDPLAETPDGGLIVFEHWITRNEKANHLFDELRPLVQYVVEDDTPFYFLYLLKQKTKENNVTFITVIRFESDNQYDQYMQDTARTLSQNRCMDKGLLIEPVSSQRLKIVAGFPYRGTNPFSAAGIHVAMAKITYASGKRSEGIKHWRHVADSVRKLEEEGTYSYMFLADAEEEDVLYSLERYKDERYLWDVHVPSAAIQDNMKKQKDIRSGLLLRGFESIECQV